MTELNGGCSAQGMTLKRWWVKTGHEVQVSFVWVMGGSWGKKISKPQMKISVNAHRSPMYNLQESLIHTALSCACVHHSTSSSIAFTPPNLDSIGAALIDAASPSPACSCL